MNYIIHKDELGNIVGLDKNEPVLKHWKYSRKYRGPSGEWVYIYDEPGSSNSQDRLRQQRMASAQRRINTATQVIGQGSQAAKSFAEKSKLKQQSNTKERTGKFIRDQISPESRKRKLKTLKKAGKKVVPFIKWYMRQHLEP